MSYPLFDSNFTLWAADLDERLMMLTGACSRRMGVDPKELREQFYKGQSVQSALAELTQRYGQAA
ncbi:MAG TPA: hypothetical protein VLL76_03800 [Candidatus Omnitrophota bacterium]|nr:hypothetical protein [Candidatus Omnitrophota bacterium]